MIQNFSINGIACFPKIIPLQVIIFPGGEPHVKLFEQIPQGTNLKECNISIRLNSFLDVGKLLSVHNAIINAGGSIKTLVIPYFPGARQDKRCLGEAFTIQIYADLINRLKTKNVIIFDPHSEVTPSLINNIRVIPQKNIWKSWIQKQMNSSVLPVVLISPDKGASEKTKLLAKQEDIVQCSKKRDSSSGKLSNFKVHIDSLNGKHGIIVDDICDGGGTFLGLAKELRKKGILKLTLCVTHGIFSKGIQKLLQHYDEIITTNSISSEYQKPIKTIPLSVS